jgi:hypothetical protein
MATATKGELMVKDESCCFCDMIIHSPVETLERDHLRRVKLTSPTPPAAVFTYILYCKIRKTPPFDNASL